jgi:hypothetical protein
VPWRWPQGLAEERFTAELLPNSLPPTPGPPSCRRFSAFRLLGITPFPLF